ncbi:hypothetical protein GGR51DRAFT_576884 [Nemania sp. FL0031]|nr:hypothetical protein GGR51DRAFT_576884 [Nemania sp. FL0031]
MNNQQFLRRDSAMPQLDQEQLQRWTPKGMPPNTSGPEQKDPDYSLPAPSFDDLVNEELGFPLLGLFQFELEAQDLEYELPHPSQFEILEPSPPVSSEPSASVPSQPPPIANPAPSPSTVPKPSPAAIPQPSASIPQGLSQSASPGLSSSVLLQPPPIAIPEPSPITVPKRKREPVAIPQPSASIPPGLSQSTSLGLSSSVPLQPPPIANPESSPSTVPKRKREREPVAIPQPSQSVPLNLSSSISPWLSQSATPELLRSATLEPSPLVSSEPPTPAYPHPSPSATLRPLQPHASGLSRSVPQAPYPPKVPPVPSADVPPVVSPAGNNPNRLLYGFGQVPPRRLPDRAELARLDLRARDMPDHWVCEVCMGLHPATPDDTPLHGLGAEISCPLKRIEWGRRAYASVTACRLDYRLPYQLDHRHIQLALKWTRLDDPARLAQLLELIWPSPPLSYEPTFEPEPNFPTTATYQVLPRIVKKAGIIRFMTKTIWSFTPRNHHVNCDTVRDLAICPHLFRYGRGPHLANSPLYQIIRSLLYNTGANGSTSGKCPFCPTEYVITMTLENVQVIAWQDFGSESSPAADWWRTGCIWSLDSTVENQRLHEDGVNTYRLGLISNLYENTVEVKLGLYEFKT